MLNGHVSHWWQQVGTPGFRKSLPGEMSVDVAIVGAGYTGLWTAYYLKKAQPDLRVVVLEQQFAGYGASGRNGGWLTNSVTGGRGQYVKSHGHDAAERMQRALNETVDEVIRVAEAEGIDADIVKGGEFNVARSEAQEARMRAYAAAEQRWRYTDLELLEASEARDRVNVSGLRTAVWHPHAARVQPAKLAQGLAEACERLGVEIYEQTRVTEIRPHLVLTEFGNVHADVVVRATEGFTAGLKGLKREWLPMNSSIIATEQLSDDLWNEIGWSGREVMGDFAHVYMYAQRTADNRIVFGGRGVPYRFGSRTDNDGSTQPITAQTLGDLMRRFFPMLENSRIEHLWSGVLGVPRDWSATVGLDRSTGIAWAGGYVGTGVTATNLAGRTLTDMILNQSTELTGLPWVNHRVRKWEPEPLRYIATHGMYWAYGLADRAEDRGGKKTNPIASIADVITGRK